MNMRIILLSLLPLMLAACSSAPTKETSTTPAPIVAGKSTASGSGGYLEGDGPGSDAPTNLDAIPDAIPSAEPLNRYANRPYTALGQTYTPLTSPGNYKMRGIASWYGKKFHGQHTATGEVYDMYGMTAAHPTLPLPSYARVTNLRNNKSVVVRVNDRGPFLHNRIIDLSYTAAHKLGIIGAGSSEVEVESLAADSAPLPLAVAEPVRSEALAPEASPVATDTAATKEGVYLQLGAFKSQSGAESFLGRMRAEFEGSGKQLMLSPKDDLVRVHLGPYASAEEARANAEKLQSRLGFKPFVSIH